MPAHVLGFCIQAEKSNDQPVQKFQRQPFVEGHAELSRAQQQRLDGAWLQPTPLGIPVSECQPVWRIYKATKTCFTYCVLHSHDTVGLKAVPMGLTADSHYGTQGCTTWYGLVPFGVLDTVGSIMSAELSDWKLRSANGSAARRKFVSLEACG